MFYNKVQKSCTWKECVDPASLNPLTYKQPELSSRGNHLKETIGILSILYPRLSLRRGTVWDAGESFWLLGVSLLISEITGTAQRKMSPLLYPTTTLLPKIQAQAAETTVFGSCDEWWCAFPPATNTALLSWIPHRVINPSLKIIRILFRNQDLES